jgi:hypothetical protein
MLSFVSLFVSGVLLAAPAAANSTEARVRQLQDRFAQRLYDELLPKLNEMNISEASAQVLSTAGRLWKEVLGNQQPLLTRRAEELLAALDRAPTIDQTKYEIVAETHDVKELMEGKEAEQAQPYLAMLLWNPVAAADFAASQLQVRALGAERFGKRAILGQYARPSWLAIDRDLDRPRLMKRMGPEVMLVELLLQKGGYYLPSRVRWLRLK